MLTGRDNTLIGIRLENMWQLKARISSGLQSFVLPTNQSPVVRVLL